MINSNIKQMKVLLLVAALMLCFAVIPVLPYSYYVLLRWVVCFAAAYGAFCIKDHETTGRHFVPLVIIACLFNPLVPVYLSRLAWLPVDLGCAVYFLTLSKKI